MEENYQGYNQPEYENDDPRKGANKSILGYRIVIIILAVILAAITVLYYNIHRQQQADYDLLVIDRDSIQNNLSDLMQDFDDLQLSNDTLSLQMGIERQRADSLMQRLKQERSWSLAKIKQYEKEVGTLRTIMRGYLHQIDSLNTLNKKLIDENVSYRKEITTAQMRAEMAEEKAQELNNKVRQGSVINARGIRMVALNARSKEVSRIKNAERLRVDFTLTANALATPGEKTIYVRILSPDGYVLSSESVPTFEFEGERLSYSASRDVDYQNEDLNIGIFYTGSGFTAGLARPDAFCHRVVCDDIYTWNPQRSLQESFVPDQSGSAEDRGILGRNAAGQHLHVAPVNGQQILLQVTARRFQQELPGLGQAAEEEHGFGRGDRYGIRKGPSQPLRRTAKNLERQRITLLRRFGNYPGVELVVRYIA